MKRGLNVITLLLLAIVLVVSACGKESLPSPSSNAGEKPAPTNQSSQNSQQDDIQEPVEFSIMNVAWNTPPVDGSPQQKWYEEKTNTRIKWEWVPAQDYLNRQNVSLATGDIADVVQLQSSGTSLLGPEQVEAIDHGIFHDLTPYITAPDFAEKYPNLSKYPQSLWDKVKYNGKIYGIPRDTAPELFDGLWLRKDLFEKSGLEVPTTVEELADVIIKLSSPPNNYGLVLLSGSRVQPLEIAFTGVHNWGINEQGEFFYNAFMPEYKDYLEYMRNLYVNKGIDPEFTLGTQNSDFLDGKSAVMFHNWHAFVKAERPHQNFKEQALDKGAEAMQILPVKGPKGYTVYPLKGFNRMTVINSKVAEKNIEAILRFIDFSGSKEYGDLIKFGLEGVHHEVVDGKKAVKEKEYQSDVVIANNWFNHMNRDAEYWINDFSERGVDQESLNVAIEVSKFQDKVFAESNIMRDPTFSLNSKTFNSKWAQLTKDLEDNITKVIMNAMSLEEWDKYVNGIISSDTYKQILDEYKTAYN